MNLTLITDATPELEPLSVLEVEQYLRLDNLTEADTLAILITATRLLAESANGRQLAQKQWRLSLDRFPNTRNVFSYPYSSQYTDPMLFQFAVGPSYIELLDPTVTVDTFTYKTGDGTVVPMVLNTDYIVDLSKHPAVVCPPFGKTWPTTTNGLWPSSAVNITFTAGFTPDTVPTSIKQGMMLLISQMFEQRMPFDALRTVAEIPYSVTALFAVGKIWRF